MAHDQNPKPDLAPTSVPAGAALSDNLRAMLWMFVSACGFAAMGALMKFAATTLPQGVVLFHRLFFTMVPLLPWIVTHPRTLATRRIGLHALRGALSFVAIGAYLYSLVHLKLADAVSISFTRPLFVILTAAIILGETMRGRRGIATAVGFAGVLVMVRPTGTVEIAMLVGIFAAFVGSLTLITVKQLAATEAPSTIVFYSSTVSSLLALGWALIEWRTPTPIELLWVGLSALGATVGQYAAARASKHGDATIIAPMDFTRLPVAAAIGFLLFAELPTAYTVAGAAVILSAVIYIGREEALARGGRAAT
ncbi:MAG: DMT family transporter [Proteobacteria bacterium]|nr:DMT family transporter [Pseudomonadota bacterium]